MSHLRHIGANAVRGEFIIMAIEKAKSIPSGKRQMSQKHSIRERVEVLENDCT